MKKQIVSVIFNSSLITKFVFDVSIPLFSQVPIRYKQRQTMVTLKIHNSGLDRLGTAHFLTLRHLCYQYWARLTNNPLFC